MKLVTVLVTALAIVPATACVAQSPPVSLPSRGALEPIAILETEGARERWLRSFRAVALRMPCAYVIDREGDLYVFDIDPTREPGVLAPVRVLKQAGDGNDLAVCGDSLLLCRWGHLEVYALDEPTNPRHVGSFGPELQLYHSQTIVAHRQCAYLIGREGVVTYDISDLSCPRFMGRSRTRGYGWTACADGDHLYVGEIGAGSRQGIAVYDIADPFNPKEVGFVPTAQAAYHLFALPGQRLLASLDADSMRHSGPDVHGNASMFDVQDAHSRPELIAELPNSGGRSAVVLGAGGGHHFACSSTSFPIAAKGLGEGVRYRSLRDGRRYIATSGSTLDGAPYHGDTDDGYVALAFDLKVVLLRYNPDAHAGRPRWGQRIMVRPPDHSP